ncbi:hypothetical protein ACNKHL_06100 [Shigella flexneri]
MGLPFVCYQHDLEKGFLTVQKGSMAKRWRNTLNLSAAVIFCAAGSEGRERLSRKRVIAGLIEATLCLMRMLARLSLMLNQQGGSVGG